MFEQQRRSRLYLPCIWSYKKNTSILKCDLQRAKLYSILNDGNTDTCVIRYKLICLFLNDGVPRWKLNIEPNKNEDAESIK